MLTVTFILGERISYRCSRCQVTGSDPGCVCWVCGLRGVPGYVPPLGPTGPDDEHVGVVLAL